MASSDIEVPCQGTRIIMLKNKLLKTMSACPDALMYNKGNLTADYGFSPKGKQDNNCKQQGTERSAVPHRVHIFQCQ